MRIANNSIFNAVVNNMMKNQERFLKLGEDMASGKRVHKASDDPPTLTRILGFRTTVASLDQFQRTINQATSWQNVSEANLTHIEEVLIRAKEVALSQASDTVSADSRKAAAKQVDALLQEAVQDGNAQFGNQFLFSGRKTNVAPFLSDGTYQGDSSTIEVEIDGGTLVTLNTPGDVAFKGVKGGVDIFGVLQDLKKALEANDRPGIAAQIDALDRGVNQVLNVRTDVGVRMIRLASEQDKLTGVSEQLTQLLGETEGVDVAKAITDLTQQQFIYQASLAATARTIQPTLLDFLR
ncbi:MAG: flagellar hook-associated protein FlgL [Nitrospinae bacterium]|nr:flagellar hook-associated protein FlgL [Nitrospinota bacterium]